MSGCLCVFVSVVCVVCVCAQIGATHYIVDPNWAEEAVSTGQLMVAVHPDGRLGALQWQGRGGVARPTLPDLLTIAGATGQKLARRLDAQLSGQALADSDEDPME